MRGPTSSSKLFGTDDASDKIINFEGNIGLLMTTENSEKTNEQFSSSMRMGPSWAITTGIGRFGDGTVRRWVRVRVRARIMARVRVKVRAKVKVTVAEKVSPNCPTPITTPKIPHKSPLKNK